MNQIIPSAPHSFAPGVGAVRSTSWLARFTPSKTIPLVPIVSGVDSLKGGA